MAELLGYVSIVGLQIETVTTAAEIGCMVVFEGDLAIRAGLEESASAGSR